MKKRGKKTGTRPELKALTEAWGKRPIKVGLSEDGAPEITLNVPDESGQTSASVNMTLRELDEWITDSGQGIRPVKVSPCWFLGEVDSAEADCVEHIMSEYENGRIDREGIALLAKAGILPYPVNELVALIMRGDAKEKRGRPKEEVTGLLSIAKVKPYSVRMAT